MTNLSFATLRHANTLRLPQFKNSRGGPAHSQPDGSDWSLGDWMNAILGELGEAANLIKKVKRGDMPLDDAREELGKEFADIVIYSDITAFRMNIRLTVWDRFEQMERVARRPWGRSLGEVMNRAAGYFGVIATQVEESRGQVSLASRLSTISQAMNAFVLTIQDASVEAGIDLGREVGLKFNAVSLRVGAPVYIKVDDTVTEDADEIRRLRGV